MKKVLVIIILLVAGIAYCGDGSTGKYAIFLHAGNETNEGMARAVHALLYARDLAQHGYSVALIFDGAATGWANELRKPENPLHKHYLKIKELAVVEEICDYCADSFDMKDDLPEIQRKLLTGDYKGHPSLVKWIERGYQIIML